MRRVRRQHFTRLNVGKVVLPEWKIPPDAELEDLSNQNLSMEIDSVSSGPSRDSSNEEKKSFSKSSKKPYRR